MPNARDRVKCATATTGTGTMTLGAAVAGYRTFASAFTADVIVSYVIEDGTAWEVGVGTYSVANNTLTRTTVDASSASGAKLTLTGSAMVMVSALARDNVTDWPFMQATNASDATLSGNTFTQIVFDTVVRDTHNAFNLATDIYTIPQDGVYDCYLKFRLKDINLNDRSYGVGIHTGTAGADTPDTFRWGLGTLNRQFIDFGRTAYFTAGTGLMAVGYMDNYTETYNAVSLTILRVR